MEHLMQALQTDKPWLIPVGELAITLRDEPTRLLERSEEVEEKLKKATKLLFDYSKKEDPIAWKKKSILKELTVMGLTVDQIWEELCLENQPFLQRASSYLGTLRKLLEQEQPHNDSEKEEEESQSIYYTAEDQDDFSSSSDDVETLSESHPSKTIGEEERFISTHSKQPNSNNDDTITRNKKPKINARTAMYHDFFDGPPPFIDDGSCAITR
jgi:hypothetical protein